MEFASYIVIGFNYNGKRYNHKVEKSEIDKETYEDTWVYYFEEDGLSFEVWGGLDEDGEPATGCGDTNQCIPFAVNVYEIDVEDGEGTQLEQIDEVDVEECV